MDWVVLTGVSQQLSYNTHGASLCLFICLSFFSLSLTHLSTYHKSSVVWTALYIVECSEAFLVSTY